MRFCRPFEPTPKPSIEREGIRVRFAGSTRRPLEARNRDALPVPGGGSLTDGAHQTLVGRSGSSPPARRPRAGPQQAAGQRRRYQPPFPSPGTCHPIWRAVMAVWGRGCQPPRQGGSGKPAQTTGEAITPRLGVLLPRKDDPSIRSPDVGAAITERPGGPSRPERPHRTVCLRSPSSVSFGLPPF